MVDKHRKYVQEILGHASIYITLHGYSHVLPRMDAEFGEAMENALR
jgi:integrase